MARLVIGLGTGRCGTVTLTQILGHQQGVRASHESWSPVPWEGEQDHWAGRISEKVREVSESILAEVAFYWLPYTRTLLEADSTTKAIVLKRPKDEVVASYLRKIGPDRNHWTQDGRNPDDVWNQSYPDYDCGKEEGIARYWDDYYAECETLAAEFSGRLALINTSDLNDSNQREIRILDPNKLQQLTDLARII